LSTKVFWLLSIVAVATICLVGCGGSSGGSSEEITVKPGSLSKAAFIRRANAICATARSAFEQAYVAFAKDNAQPGPKGEEESYLLEVIEKVVVPNYEKGMATEISKLGAPSSEVESTSEFVNAISHRIEELRENPHELVETPFPFKDAAAVAKAKGFATCAASFS